MMTENNADENNADENNTNEGNPDGAAQNENLDGSSVNPTSPESAQTKPGRFGLKAVAVVVGSILIGSVGAGTVSHFMNKAQDTEIAQSEQQIIENQGKMNPLMTQVVPFNDSSIKGAKAQKALAYFEGDGTPTASAQFAFSAKKSDEVKRIDAYVDFGSTRAADFALLTRGVIESAVMTGKADVTIHPVVTKAGGYLSVYAPEALALAMSNGNPDDAWKTYNEIAGLSQKVNVKDKKAVLKALVDVLKSKGMSVKSADITTGYYASWTAAVLDDEKIVGKAPTVVYVDDVVLKSPNDAKELRTALDK